MRFKAILLMLGATLITFSSIVYFNQPLFQRFSLSSKEINESKYLPWEMDFKNRHIYGCAGGVLSDLMKKKFCTCVIEKIEKAHIIITKYNFWLDDQISFIKKTESQINSFMNTIEGRHSIEECYEKMADAEDKKENSL